MIIQSNRLYAFKFRFVEKDIFAAALRAHQAAVVASKSPHREAAEELLSKYRRQLHMARLFRA